jgi:MFS family permease
MVTALKNSDRATTDRPGRAFRAPDHDRFVAMCERRGIDLQRADALWQDLIQDSEIGARRGLSRAVLGTAVIGAMLLSAAGIWWATLVTSAAGAPGLVGLALAWIVAATAAAEVGRRRMIPYVDAVASVVAVAYTGVVTGAVLYSLAGSSFATHWWARAIVETSILAAGLLALWRYRRPLVTMAAPTVAVVALVTDALVSSFDGWDRDITDWPLWVAFAGIVVAALFTAVGLVLDHRGMRNWALWPSLGADFATVAAIVGIAAAAGAGPRGVGVAFALAGLAILVRGAVVGRLTQIAIGAAVFWVGAITLGSTWGSLAVAAMTTLAGLSMIAGAILLTRRRDLLTQRWHHAA